MTKTELEALRTKYADLKGDTSFSVASVDINAMLDALPESPRNKLLRTKYLDQKADHNMPGWIVQQDIEMLAKEVVPIESEIVPPVPPEEPKATVPDLKLPPEGAADNVPTDTEPPTI